MAKEQGLVKTAKGMAWMSAVTISDYVINLVMTYFLARILTPSDYGEVAAITVLVGFANIFWQLGVGSALVQKKDLSDDDVVTANTLNIIFGLSIFLIINIFAPFWQSVFSIPNRTMLRVYSSVFVINSILATPKSLTQKKCKFKNMAIIMFITTVLYGAFAIVFANLGFKAWSLVYANIGSLLFKMIAFLLIERTSFKFYINKGSAKSLMYFGGGQTIARVFNYIANNGDNFVINKTMGKTALGNYSKAHSLLGYFAQLIGQTMDNVLFPVMSEYQDNTEKLRRSYYMGTGVVALFAVPVSVVCYFCAEDLVLFYLGEKWTSVILPFRLMIAGLFFRTAYKLSDSLIRAIGKVYQRSVVQAIYAALILLTAYMGHFFGLWAVALGVTLTYVINYFMMFFLCAKFVRLKLGYCLKTVIPSLLYGATAAFAIGVCDSLFIKYISNHFLVCAIVAVIGFAVYGGVFLLTRRKLLTSEMNSMVDTIYSAITKKIKKAKVN